MVSKREIASATKTLRQLCLLEFSTGPGEAPKFTEPSGSEALLKRLEEIAAVVRNDGTFNGRSPHAERYAICLVKQRDYEIALQLFKAIVGNAKSNILFLGPDEGGRYPSSSVSPKPGKLGYEGIFQYAVVCLRLGFHQQARVLFGEIVEKISTECFPIRLQDIRLETLLALKSLGVPSLDGKISATRAHCY